MRNVVLPLIILAAFFKFVTWYYGIYLFIYFNTAQWCRTNTLTLLQVQTTHQLKIVEKWWYQTE